MSDAGEAIEISTEDAASFAEVAELLAQPIGDKGEASHAAAAAAVLGALLAGSGAPLTLGCDGGSGRCLLASRDIAEGAELLSEEAAAWFVARAPGRDGLYTISDRDGTLLCTLPAWAALRTLRDTLTFAPRFVGHADVAWRQLATLLATGGTSEGHACWASLPTTPPGIPTLAQGGSDNAVPARAQMLAAIAQVNAFSAALPSVDSEWRRGILWPTLCRISEAGDRDRLFDDDEPLSHVSALFPLAAQFNHACGVGANVRYSCVWAEGTPAPRITFVAARALAAGEELLHDYSGGADDECGARRRKLLLSHRFRCRCVVCAADMSAAGVDDDPLAGAFPHGAGAGGTAYFLRTGGRYPRE